VDDVVVAFVDRKGLRLSIVSGDVMRQRPRDQQPSRTSAPSILIRWWNDTAISTQSGVPTRHHDAQRNKQNPKREDITTT
jgi:hypothetical protein